MPEEYDEGPEWKPPPPPEENLEKIGQLGFVLESIKYLVRRARPLRKHWLNTGVATISTGTSSTGTYEAVVSFTNDLGFPAITGVVQNRGPGNLFFVVSVQPDDLSANEIRLNPGQTFRWGGPDNPHQIYYLHVRADVDNTDYQIMGGSGKLELTEDIIEFGTLSIRSDKDVNFTGGIVQNAKEDENLTGLASNKIMIKAVRIEADQALDFVVIFWSKDTFDDTNLDDDTFIDFVRFQLDGTAGLDFIQPGGAGQFYGSKTGLNIPYRDDDLTKELHVSLLNLSSTAKDAGAGGEVIIEVDYELRLEL